MQSTYLLVAHGSRDPRPQQALEKLAKLLSERLAMQISDPLDPIAANLNQKGVRQEAGTLPRVGSATLEFGPSTLHEQIRQFGEYTLGLGCSRVRLLPLFLLPGVHVKEDIPAEVAIAQQAIDFSVKIDLGPHLGSQVSGLVDWMVMEMASSSNSTNIQEFETPQWILLSHGSRRSGGNLVVEEMTSKIGAVTAYWSISPSLEAQVANLVRCGHQRIGILPYFLFGGGITDAIAQMVQQLQQQFPQMAFHLANPLDASVKLADLIWDLMQE